MTVVFLSAIPGTEMHGVAHSLEHHASSLGKKIKIIFMEELLATAYKLDFPKSEFAEGSSLLYNEPKQGLRSAAASCTAPLESLVSAAENDGCEVVFIFLHCVFSSVATLEQFTPYASANFTAIAQLHRAVFCNLVNDVYETRSVLSETGYLSRLDNDWRNPALDFFELRRLLEWRKIECVVAETLALELKLNFVLLHAKTPVLLGK